MANDLEELGGLTRGQGRLAIALLALILVVVASLTAVTFQPAWSIKNTAGGPRYSDRVREFRRSLWRISSYTETGLNIVKHSELVAEANFERNAALLDLSEADKALESWKDLSQCLDSYREAGSAWKSANDAGYNSAPYDQKRQEAWTKATEMLVKAEQLLRQNK